MNMPLYKEFQSLSLVSPPILNLSQDACTGNDFSRLFAPLIRDGRMEKFYWDPNDQELVEIIYQMYKDDDLTKDDIQILKDTFPNQRLPVINFSSQCVALSFGLFWSYEGIHLRQSNSRLDSIHHW